VTPELIDLVAASWKDQVLWLRNHPSIFVWAEASDMVPHPDLERRYIEIQKEIDPTRPTLVSTKGKTSEITGPSGVKMLGPYDYVPPVYWYVDTKTGGAYGFNTETGPGPQVPPLESLRKMIPRTSSGPSTTSGTSTAAAACSRPSSATTKPWTAASEKPPTSRITCARPSFLNYEGMRPCTKPSSQQA